MRKFFNFVRQIFLKKESRSPRGFLPRPLLRAGETAFRTPPPFPQTKEAGCGQGFFSKKVRAKDTISPQIDTSRFERADARRVGGTARDNFSRRFAANWLGGGISKRADLAVSYQKTI
jgi:hypothetical protein